VRIEEKKEDVRNFSDPNALKISAEARERERISHYVFDETSDLANGILFFFLSL